MSRLTRRDFLLSVALSGAAALIPETPYAQAQKQDGGIKMNQDLTFGLGIVSFAVAGGFDNPDPATLVERVNQLEIPGKERYVELLIMPTTQPQGIEKIATALKDARYKRTGCGFRPGEKTPDMMSADESEVNLALEQMYHIMECGQAGGITRISGPLFRNHGNTTSGDGRHLEKALTSLAAKAEKIGIYLSVEMLNAFEMCGFNNVYTTLPIINKIGSKHLLIHFDPAHGAREELHIIPATTEVYQHGKLGHVHISEPGRGPIGSGYVGQNLVPFLYNLGALGYGNNGEVAIVEVFHPSMYGAVKRVDNLGISQRSPAEQDAFALKEARESIHNVAIAYNIVRERLVPRK
jgi:sugar phosphate isomerase/epimerase